ncbi:MAG TPA: TadE/TadG family type IV pilus assembly protein [Anaerolineales bacterium]|nr:TadE/TadG family type IV pilus assembly protein [Anaerolineales bacterium]
MRQRQRGQELVEYALALPIFLLLIMSILDLGRGVYCYSAIFNSVREGARYGIIHPGDGAGIEAVVRAKAVGLDPAALNVFSLQPDADTIQVTATYTFTAVTPIVSVLVGSNQWVIGSRSTMQIEG